MAKKFLKREGPTLRLPGDCKFFAFKCVNVTKGKKRNLLKTITWNDLDHVFFITDQSCKDSIKSSERNRTANTGSICLTAARLEQKLPKQNKKYLWCKQGRTYWFSVKWLEKE